MKQSATFGAGCFWGVEAAFAKVPGVVSTEVGYAGGWEVDPSYQQVCAGGTGHTEVVRVVFDPERTPYQTLLDAFWACHDPTQTDGQGLDRGYQYRSVIFSECAEQDRAARDARASLEASGRYSKPISTRIEAFRNFYRAEEYHQRYLERQGLAACGV